LDQAFLETTLPEDRNRAPINQFLVKWRLGE
jgi:hypothetical protein